MEVTQSLHSSKDLCFRDTRTERSPLGLIFTCLVPSKCVFSLLPSLLLCAADSSQDLTERSHRSSVRRALHNIHPSSLPPNRLKLLHPPLLTGLPGTTERISTQIKRALLVWCQGFETRLIPFDQWAPCWWLSSTTLLRPVSDLFSLSLSVSLKWSRTEMTKQGLFRGHYSINW